MLEQLNTEMTGRGLVILGVEADPRAADHSAPASLEDLAAYGRRFGLTYPLLFDPGRAQLSGYAINGYPTLYAIDGTGTVRWSSSGEVQLDVLRQVAGQLLGR